MKDCEICGNEIPDAATVCPFCEHPQHGRPPPPPAEKLRTINIKEGLPTIDDALRHLDGELGRARQAGVKVVRIIHGWGASGKGGGIREACRSFLTRELKAKRIKAIQPGDTYSRSSVSGRALMSKYPDLRSSERTDSNNPGITFVEL
jgi:hypothetical protein